MKNLKAIIEKYSQISHNADNYEIGGGLDSGKFASRRHEDAKNDFGKLTLGKAAQMFKKAVGSDDVEFIKEVLSYAVPNMEWHHAGKLPKQYGGGMKKTYFLNSYEIVKIAENWDDYTQKLELSKADKRKAAELQKSREEVQQEFLKLNAEKVTRVSKVPEFFYETGREMQGKYGWFSAYGKSYNLPEYYTGWKFADDKTLQEFLCI